MKKCYIVIDHCNGEIEDVFIMLGEDFAHYLEKSIGFLVFELDLDNLSLKRIKK